MKPDLTLIIPCYNCEETLREAVDSVYASDIRVPFEVILVNDASTDGTKALIIKLAEKYPGLKYYSNEKNLGGGATRNAAVVHGSGELIFCLDSDDMLPPDTLQKLVDYQREKDCDGVGVSTSVKFKGRDVRDVAFTSHFSYVGEKIPFESLLERDGVSCSLYSTFLITRAAFDKIGGYPTGHGFDTQGIAWRFCAAGFIAYTCPNAAYLHRIQFHESYYLRESNAGRINYNWQDIFFENFSLFDKATQDFIRTFDCKDISKNIFDELKKRDRVFKPNYHELLGHVTSKSFEKQKRIYIKRRSLHGFFLRIKGRLMKIL